MKITNKYGLPQPIVDAVKNDNYSSGGADISVTALISPPRIKELERRHKDELEEDASERIWSLMGQVVHGILERADKTGQAEIRSSISVDGWVISGQVDRYIDGLVQDYKVVSVHSIKKGVPENYEQQLNIYAEILRQNNHPVNKLELVCILRDWSKLEYMRDSAAGYEYPPGQVVVLPVRLWDGADALSFIKDRVAQHKAARITLPECSKEDRWQKPDIWAIMKEGRKSALKLCTSEEEAKHIVGNDGEKGVYIVKRPGKCIRCESYCSVNKFCDFYQQLTKGENDGE